MFVANTHVIRLATDDDGFGLRWLAKLGSQRPLSDPVLVGEIDGTPAAAVSLSHGRVIAGPFRRTVPLVSYLRVSAVAVSTHETPPSRGQGIRAALLAW